MALTRSQLIAGDSSQGPVLPGQVQGVKQGDGVVIGLDGRISFLASTSQGVVKLNNSNAYNAYVWPNSSGPADTFLGVDGNGNLAWAVPDGLVNLGSAPVDPKLGELWYSYSTQLLYVRQDKGGTESWQPVYQGLNPDPASTSASPAFSGGVGTEEDPFLLSSVTTKSGNTVLFPSTVTITGFAPYQYVSIYDIHGDTNGYRFEPTSFFADEGGTLAFKVKYTDFPQTPPNTSRSATFRVGFDSPIFIDAAVGITSPVSIINPGSITGTPQVGEVLSYIPGTAAGGTPPYNYTWIWKLASTNEVLQVDGSSYTISSLAANDRIYVELTATDSSLDAAIANTGVYPFSPELIGKGAFPNTNILFPTTTTSSVSTLWADAGTSLSSDGCIEFAIDGITFSQGPTVIANGGTITTRWISSAGCGNAANSEVISGCVYSDLYRECSTLTIDRVPSPFSFNPVTEVIPSTEAVSQTITPIGYNSVAYITFNASSTGTNIQASTDGGSTWSVLSTVGDTSVPISPGQTLTVKMTAGADYNASYTAIINMGSGNSVQSATFTATTSGSTIFVTPITFPTTTTNETTTTWLAGDGPTSLTATGCIQFKVTPSGTWTGAGDPAVPITTGDVLYTRWSTASPGVCGNAPHGTVITGSITDGSSTNNASLTIDRVPAMFSFTDLNNQAPSTVVTSDLINISGINAPTYITRSTPLSGALTSLEASVGGGAWTAIPASGETLPLNPQVSGPGTTLQIRGTTGGSSNVTYSAIVNIGQGSSVNSDTWNVSTSSTSPSIVTPSILTPVNGATGLNPNSSSPPGITVTSSTYTAINGAGTHTGTDWEVYYMDGITPVYAAQVTNSATNLTSYFVPIANLLPNKTYYARVRYRTTTPSSILSNWSNLSQFSTATVFDLQWVVRAKLIEDGAGPEAVATDPAPGGYTVIVAPQGVARTLDGVVFSSVTVSAGTLGAVKALAFGAGKFVAVTANDDYWVSTNSGLSWSQFSFPGTFDITRSIAYSPSLDLFCAVGDLGGIYTSPASSLSWTRRTSPTTQRLESVIWDGTSFKACGGTALLNSTNGVSWSLTTIALAPDGSELNKIVYNSQSSRYFISRGEGIGSSPTRYGVYSVNGTSWVSTTVPMREMKVAAGGNWFVGGTSKFIDNGLEISTSNDAVAWAITYSNPDLENSEARTRIIHYIPQVQRFIVGAGNWTFISTV